MKRLTTIFFLSTIMIFMFCLVPFSIARRTVVKLTEPEEAIIDIDWEKLYPFEDNRDIVRREKFSLAAYLKEKVENYTSNKLAGSYLMIETAKTYEELIGWNIAAAQGYNPVVKLSDGYLSSFVVSKDVSENAKSVIELDDFCRSLGIECMYINLPYKICVYEDRNISGILDFSNQNADNLLSMLRESGVSAYDFRKLLHEDCMNHHEAFYRTDHHWKSETGLWAARHILEILRDDYGWDVKPEILSPENFEYEVYREWFLGSQGKKLTLARTEPDDITIIYPKFSTSLHIEIPNKNVDLSGDFAVTYDMSKVEKKDYYNLSSYGAYNHGRNPLCITENFMTYDDKKFMLVYDSFSDSVIPFLALGIRNVYAVDLRQFSGSVRACIKAFKPDALTVIYTAEFSGATGDLYDFR